MSAPKEETGLRGQIVRAFGSMEKVFTATIDFTCPHCGLRQRKGLRGPTYDEGEFSTQCQGCGKVVQL